MLKGSNEKNRQHARWMDNVSREMETLRKNRKEMLEIKKPVTKNAIHGLTSRLDRAEESVSEIGDMPIETSKTERQRGKKLKTEQSIQALWGNYKRYSIKTMGIPRGEEKKEQKKYLNK